MPVSLEEALVTFSLHVQLPAVPEEHDPEMPASVALVICNAESIWAQVMPRLLKQVEG